MSHNIKEVITKAADLIKEGKLVVFPTETVYALACACDNDQAIKMLYQVKGRSFKKPLAILGHTKEQLAAIAQLDARAVKLFDKLTPGPLTLVVELQPEPGISPMINMNNQSIGVRIPNHKIALEIIRQVGKPVVATSANISGQPDGIDPNIIKTTIGPLVDLIIEDGQAKLGSPSTVVDLRQKEFVLLRQGTITLAEITNILQG